MRTFCLIATILLGTTACGVDELGMGQSSLPATIECHAAYRSTVTVGIEREDSVTLGHGDQQQIAFDRLTVNFAYSVPKTEGPALQATISATGTDQPIATALYQLKAPVSNQFEGGHGFTGLQYAYHDTGAELQYWCIAR